MAGYLSIVIISLLFQFSPSISASNGIRFQLMHIDSKLNLTKPELYRRGVERTKHRIASLTNSLVSTLTNNVQAPVHWDGSGYQTEIAIGTPSTPLNVVVDSGSDLLWTQCEPCTDCYPQADAIYNPSSSTSFSKIDCSSSLCQSLPSQCNGTDCDYGYAYVDNSFTEGVLASESFSFGSTSVPGVAFGCGQDNSLPASNGADGLMGLGRGPLSIVTQLGSGKFSYCLTSFGESNTSPLLLGSLAVLSGSVQSTPLVQNPKQPSLYYLTLQGITVGSTLLQIPSTAFALNSDGNGGLVIDSGSTFTALQSQAYEVLKKEFQSQVDLPVADNNPTYFKLCFSFQPNSQVTIPDIVFHFDGADMGFPHRNYMIYYTDIGLLCLAVLESEGISILGSFQQQNMHIIYDLNGNALSFASAQCDQL